MKILEKYVFTSYITAFFMCVILLMVLGIVGDILGFLDDIVKNQIPLASILSFYFYLAPFAFVNMVPFAALLSAVYVFNNLSKNHEVTAVIASGLSLWKLLRPVLLVTFLLCLATFIVNDKFVPETMKRSVQIRQNELEQSEDKTATLIRDIAIYGKGNQMIYVKTFDPKTSTLNDVIIQRQDKNLNIIEKISAGSVTWNYNKKEWIGHDVVAFKVDSKGNFSGDPEVFKAKIISIEEDPEIFQSNQWDPRFMSYGQLKKYLKLFKSGSPSTTRRLLVDLNYKLALPFTALITVLIGVPFSIETGRASALIGMARGITVGMLYLPVMAVSLALGKNGTLPPVMAAWLCNVLFAGFGIVMVNRKS